MVVDTCGSSFDTKLAVYEGCPAGNNLALGCDDDADPACANSTLNSRVIVPVTQGHIYLIRVGGFRTTGGVESFGSGLLNISCEQAACPADLGQQGGVPGQDGQLDNNDFIAFINFFFASNPAADLGVQGGVYGSDGQFDNNDFISFINLFFAGCP
ncbi:MAG: GC-type dockerin domain-anchored protein [Phycisphaerales bacterium]